MIKDIALRLPEVGKIKIGVKGQEITSSKGNKFQPPKKLSHFVITRMNRGGDGNFVPDEEAMRVYGNQPTRITVMLMFNEIEKSVFTEYRWYTNSRQPNCHGDGEVGHRLQPDGSRKEMRCPCDKLKGGGCAPAIVLNVLLPDLKRTGVVYTFRSRGWNSVRNILSSLEAIKAITGGVLAGIPLEMTVFPIVAHDPNGKQVTVFTVSLAAKGTLAELRSLAIEWKQTDLRLLSSATPVAALPAPDDAPEENKEFVEEFVPNVANREVIEKQAGRFFRDGDRAGFTAWYRELSDDDKPIAAAAISALKANPVPAVAEEPEIIEHEHVVVDQFGEVVFNGPDVNAATEKLLALVNSVPIDSMDLVTLQENNPVLWPSVAPTE